MVKQHIRTALQQSVSEADLRQWYDPLTLIEHADAGIEVVFPHLLFSRWFSSEKKDMLKQSIRRHMGHDASVVFTVPRHKQAEKKFPLHSRGAGFSESFRLPPADYEQFSFDTFIYNRKNDFPVSMARQLAHSPLNPPYTPFIICGKGVCGKTHLLRATALAMSQAMNHGRIYMGTVSDMTGYQANMHSTQQLCQNLLGHTAIFIDDAHELADHPSLQQELIHVADRCREMKKPLVLSVDDGLAQADFLAKLRSRLESGMVINLKKPDLDVRLRYVREEAARLGLFLQKEHMLSLVQRLHDMRMLQGTLTKLSAYCATSSRTLNNTDLDKILRNMGLGPGKALSPEYIIDAVSESLGVSQAEITGVSRKQDIILARQLSMFLCRELLGISYPALGLVFGGKNHATIVHACNKIKQLQESNNDTNNMITTIRKKFVSPG